MPLYVTLLEGPSPAEARALLATDDPRVVGAVVRVLRSHLKMDLDEPNVRKVLKMAPFPSDDRDPVA